MMICNKIDQNFVKLLIEHKCKQAETTISYVLVKISQCAFSVAWIQKPLL